MICEFFSFCFFFNNIKKCSQNVGEFEKNDCEIRKCSLIIKRFMNFNNGPEFEKKNRNSIKFSCIFQVTNYKQFCDFKNVHGFESLYKDSKKMSANVKKFVHLTYVLKFEKPQ